jgi:hypothetical protein
VLSKFIINIRWDQDLLLVAGPCRWLTPVILVTQEADIRRITVRSQPRQIVHKTLFWKHPSQKKGWWSGSRCRPRVQVPVLQKKKKELLLVSSSTCWKWMGILTLSDAEGCKCAFIITFVQLAVTAKNVNFGVRLPGYWLHDLPSWWPWANI